jgi:hypothetical protein
MPMLTLSFRSLAGKSVPLRFPATATVKDVRSNVCSAFSITPTNLTLVHHGTLLHDATPLPSLSLDSNVHILVYDSSTEPESVSLPEIPPHSRSAARGDCPSYPRRPGPWNPPSDSESDSDYDDLNEYAQPPGAMEMAEALTDTFPEVSITHALRALRRAHWEIGHVMSDFARGRDWGEAPPDRPWRGGPKNGSSDSDDQAERRPRPPRWPAFPPRDQDSDASREPPPPPPPLPLPDHPRGRGALRSRGVRRGRRPRSS